MHDLKKALKEICEAEMNEEILKIQSLDDHKFSAEHNAAMKQCIEKRRHPIVRFFSHAGVRAACAVIVCLILGASALQVDAIRKPFKGFLMNKLADEKSITYCDETDESKAESIVGYYVLTKLPEGYKLQFSDRSPTHGMYYYSNNDSILFFGQYPESIYRDVYIDGDSSSTEFVDDDGQSYLIIEDSECIIYLWECGDYVLHLNTPVDFNKDDAIDLCKSAKLEET